MKLSLFYFASNTKNLIPGEYYKLLIDSSIYADQNGFHAIWTPERHFHDFGGIYANPSLTTAAISQLTKTIQLRAGSIVLPLHHPIRVAEEWAMLDHLSHGRIGISIASGWHKNDFILAPDNYENRYQIMYDSIQLIQDLWQGKAISLKTPTGKCFFPQIYPKPLSPSIPLWLTIAGNREAFIKAGHLQMNVLTHLLNQDISTLADKISAYRQACLERNFKGHVTLMLHTFITSQKQEAHRKAYVALKEYLRISSDLEKKLDELGEEEMNSEDLEAILEHACDRYLHHNGLFGDIPNALEMIKKLRLIGVDEIGCLIDFGLCYEDVMEGLKHLNILKNQISEACGL